MLARTVRSGLTEGYHDGAACVADASGTVIARWGLTERPLFYRSAIKPFQATVALENGALLVDEQLAVACSSHGGHPVHLAYTEAILQSAELDDSALRCPPSWPMSSAARERLIADGHRSPTRIFHNCSGKHAGFLAACVSSGLPTETYDVETHALQQQTVEMVTQATGMAATPTGVDGCGFPTLRGTVVGLAVAFARLSTEPRFGRVRRVMSRFPALTGDSSRPDGRFGAWWPGPVKVGAMGLVGAGHSGLGIAVKSFEGSLDVAMVGIMEVTRRLGLLSSAAFGALEDVARPPVFGGGRPVGAMVPDLT